MDGVWRTRVGYCGGMLPRPNYHNIGDHSETVEIDYDPSAISYEELVGLFLTSHDPTRPHYSMQYRSAIFFRTAEEREIATAAIARASAVLGPIRTAVEPFDTFWLAEDYHQKYRLRADKGLMREMRVLCPSEADLVNSTAAARLNGWLYGYGDRTQVERDLPKTGLSGGAQEAVRGQVLRREPAHVW